MLIGSAPIFCTLQCIPSLTLLHLTLSPDKVQMNGVHLIIPLVDKKLLDRVDKMLAEDIAKLMAMVPLEEQISKNEGNDRYKGRPKKH